ncbi:MAG: serine/threonine-protein kinase [Firmicutes bacterium]|nr:serine/threonine-protein kinase [Bacillota bacterium]
MNHSDINPVPGQILNGRYEVLEKLHAGAMGVVYRAKDQRLNKIFALKSMITPDAEADRSRAGEWFEREANILCNLRHPGIPVVTDFFEELRRLWLVMDFIDGINLGSMPLPVSEAEAVKVALLALDILKYIHKKGIIHRDIKTEHFILENSSNRYFLVDFGTARFAKPAAVKTAIGTHGFASPEHYEGKADAVSDIYSLGAVLHHILTAKDPRNGIPFEFEPIEKAAPGVSQKMAFVVDKALSYYPKDRFQNAEEMEKILNEYTTADSNSKSGKTESSQAHNTKIMPHSPAKARSGSTPSVFLSPEPVEIPKITGRFNLRHAGLVKKALFISDVTIAVVFYDGTVVFRNSADGKDEGSLTNIGAFAANCCDAAVSPDYETLALAMDDKRIFLWNLNTRRRTATLSEHTRVLSCVRFGTKGKIISGDSGGNICIWNTSPVRFKGSANMGNSACTALAFGENDKIFFCGNDQGFIFNGNTIFLENEDAEFKSRQIHNGSIISIFHSGADDKLITTGVDGFIRIHKIESGSRLQLQNISELNFNGRPVKSTAFNNQKNLIAAGFEDGGTAIINFSGLNITVETKEHTKPVESVDISPNGKIICTADEDEIILWG